MKYRPVLAHILNEFVSAGARAILSTLRLRFELITMPAHVLPVFSISHLAIISWRTISRLVELFSVLSPFMLQRSSLLLEDLPLR